MRTSTIREEVQDYISQADERFIHLVYGMIQADKSSEFLLSDSEHQEVKKRISRHRTGDSKSYTWDEVKKRLQS